MDLQLKRLLLDAHAAGIARQPNILALPFRVGTSQVVDDFLEHSPCAWSQDFNRLIDHFY
jgi:hypothetical protein